MSARTLVLGGVLLISASLSAQQRPRDTAGQTIGTATITGVVAVDEPNGRPLRRVTVTLSAGDLSGAQSTVTDDAGRFLFANVKGGNYTVVASRPGYVSAYYGARRPGHGPGVPIAVLDAQRLTGINLRLLRGGVLTGTVRSPNGLPLPGRDVQVMLKGDGQLEQLAATANAGAITTDDRGVYRAYGLAPGDYVVIARTPQAFGAQDLRRVTSEELAWAEQLAAGRGGGAAPGVATPPAPPPAPGQTVAFASIYYPGTPDPSAAAIVGVTAGEEKSGIDITTSLVPTARITGVVLDADGRPSSGTQVQVQSSAGTTDEDLIGMLMARGGARTGTDGRFSVPNVAPGRYKLLARAAAARPAGRGGSTPNTPEQDAMAMVLQMMPGGGGGAAFWAQEEVAIEGRDVTDLTLRMQPGMTVSGRVVYEGAADPAPDPTKTRVMIMNIADAGSLGDMVSAMTNMTMASAVADGTFAAKGLTPGKYRVSLLAPGMMLTPAAGSGGWVLKSAMLNGRDVADLSFELKPSEDVAGLVITMTNRPTELSGAVIDAAGRPVAGFPIVIFSTDKAYWTFGSRRVQQARPSSDGKYRVTGLPAGEYYVCAVTDINQQELYRASFLEQLVPGSFKLVLGDGEKKTQDLKLGSGG